MLKTNPTRRRWFQFGLGTLFFVITGVAVWLGLELRVIRARQAFLRAHPRWGTDARYFESAVPRVRLWLGDENVHWILLPFDTSDEELAEAHRLFPEAGSISLVREE